ncbi:MAG: methylenetetrahydrofolate--tRNA-(uracil(54)-C(5))-methyltransferase (FADH(2)-oxidizing) TrmFO [Bacillota bacterium]|jgi:methylenetetrahydrofolate--tRNA-(uracil-5-)-methyltransferase
MPSIEVVGGGLAGVEAAWAASRMGCQVTLREMRPALMTPAHATGDLAELVCSNSLGSWDLSSASGLLKEEMRRLDSLVLRTAEATRVPAGRALAVDRRLFSRHITQEIEGNPSIVVDRSEVQAVPQAPAVLATGPLTSPSLAKALRGLVGEDNLYFYDAVAPIVAGDSIAWERVFTASRYENGSEDYVNCPMNREEYEDFWNALVGAQAAQRHAFEEARFFEGCLPVEELARRGKDTLRYGPLRPVGLVDPATGRQPYAVVQLRREDASGRLYNLVGFQTGLKWGEQGRVFRMIPGLERAGFVRYGVMHRNTYICSPRALEPTLEVRSRQGLFVAGQVTGVEGYMESAASGIWAGLNAARRSSGLDPVELPPESMLGALIGYICRANPQVFQPMKASFGLLPPLQGGPRSKRERHEAMAQRALECVDNMVKIMTYTIAN